MLPRAARRPVVWAWLTRLAVTAAVLLRFAEPVLVDHTICEHGELIHRALVARAHSEAKPQATGRGAADDGEDRRAGGSDHDHCDALAVRHVSQEMPALIQPASLLLEIAYEDVADAEPERPVAVLVEAPKTSPPAG